MQFLFLLYLDEKAQAAQGEPQRTERFAAYDAYTKALMDAGVLASGNALQPTSTARSVQSRGGEVLATDGPYAETKEQLGGYYLVECKDLNEAAHWAARCPAALGGTVEVRPILDY